MSIDSLGYQSSFYKRSATSIDRVVSQLAICIILSLAFGSGCRTMDPESGSDVLSGASPAGKDMPPLRMSVSSEKDDSRILVVYFSKGISTMRVAEDLAFVLGAETERIIEKKERKGVLGFLGAGADSSLRRSTPIQTPIKDPRNFDIIIVCTPVWAWKLAPPVRTWLESMKDGLSTCAFVVVSSATAPEKTVKMMEFYSGKKAAAYAGFIDKDFAVENRGIYSEKIATLAATLRR